ncbi:TraX family protein [Chromobacterium vaccinii]|uniref:TraX family protein n=1 Tax=Chromobacterium vaccinii TaxID=1108595 RepID=UPI003C72FB69
MMRAYQAIRQRVAGYMLFRDSQIDLLKLAAFVLMVGDHANTALFKGSVPVLFLLGRLAFPLFAIAFAAAWCRHGFTYDGRRLAKLIVRGLGWGILAQIPYVAVFENNHWWQLNMLFVFPVAVFIALLLQRGHMFSAVLLWFIAGLGFTGGAYSWGGVLMVMSLLWYYGTPSPGWLLLALSAWLVYFPVKLWIPAAGLLVGLLAVLKGVEKGRMTVGGQRILPTGTMYALYAGHLGLLALIPK